MLCFFCTRADTASFQDCDVACRRWNCRISFKDCNRTAGVIKDKFSRYTAFALQSYLSVGYVFNIVIRTYVSNMIMCIKSNEQKDSSWTMKHFLCRLKVKVKVHTLDIVPLRIVSHHRRSAQVWHVFSRDFTVLPAHPRSSAIGMSHTCLCLPGRSWYSFTDPGGMEG